MDFMKDEIIRQSDFGRESKYGEDGEGHLSIDADYQLH